MRSWERRSTFTCLVSTGDFPPDLHRVSRILTNPPDPDPTLDCLGPGCVSVSVNCVKSCFTTVSTLSATLSLTLQPTTYKVPKTVKLNAIQRK